MQVKAVMDLALKEMEIMESIISRIWHPLHIGQCFEFRSFKIKMKCDYAIAGDLSGIMFHHVMIFQLFQ